MSHEGRDIAEVVKGYIPVTGGNIGYKIVGVNRKKIPLLVLHGDPGALHDYLEPLEALSDERPVIFYDQLECGNSDKPSDVSLWTIERFVNELEPHLTEKLIGALQVFLRVIEPTFRSKFKDFYNFSRYRFIDLR